MFKTSAIVTIACLLTTALPSIAAVEVKLTVNNPGDLKRSGEPVTTGVPFAKGAVKDVSKLAATYKDGKLPAQFTLLAPWDDGSVRWALLDTQGGVPPKAKEEIVVTDAGPSPAPGKAVKVDDGADAVKVSTGALDFTINKKKFNLFQSIKVDGKELVNDTGEGLVLVLADGNKCIATDPPTEVKQEQAGPMKAIVCVRGKFPGVHNGLLQYTVRITAYAGQKYLKVHTWLENQGGYGYAERKEWFNFKGMCVNLGLCLGNGVNAKCEGVTAKDKLTVEETCGGQHKYSELKYTVKSGDKELKAGDRTDGVVALSGPNGSLNVAIRHFWQNYEKAIELDAPRLTLWLWPTDGQWPRSVNRGDCTGEFAEYRKPGLYALPGGVHKGYEAILDFSGREPEASAATLNAPLMALATPDYYASTLAAPGWFAPADFETGQADYDAKVKAWNKMARNAVDPASKSSIIGARNGAGEGRGFWYGWMDFGDMCWEPGACSLHYDWTWTMLINFLRTCERGFFDMGLEMARHRMDVDQIWSDRVNEAFRGLTRYEKAYANIHGGVKTGYYKPITSHHWASGLVLYYMLTGEEKAKEAALRSAQGVILRQVNAFRNKPNSGDQPRSSGWAILVLCSVYDMTAEKKYLDEAVLLWENNLKLKWKEKNDPTMGGGNYIQYLYVVYPMCELHARTGNPEILECLKASADQNIWTDNVIEVNHLSNLYGYVGWLTKNDAFITKGEQALAKALGNNANPPCFTGGGAWTKESAKRLRYGHILQYYHWLKKLGKLDAK